MPRPTEDSFTDSGKLPRHRRWLLSCLVLSGLFFLALSLPRGSALSMPDFVGYPTYLLKTLFLGPARVGLQVGHLHAMDHPQELHALRWNTGGHASGIDEVDLNLEVAQTLKGMLEHQGIRVDLLPATPPPRYHADLFLSLHADASPNPARRGYKSAHHREPRNRLEPLLKAHIDSAYLAASGLPDDDSNVSGSMLAYYAFNHQRYRHAVSGWTPAVIIEMGYISNAQDLEFLRDPARPAAAIHAGILSYLKARGRLR